MTVPPLPPDDRVRAMAAELLARPEYTRWRSGRIRGLVDILSAVERGIEAVRGWVGTVAEAQPLLYAALLIVMFVLAAGLFVHVAFAVRRALMRPGDALASHRQPEASSALLADAETLAGAGRVLEAAHRVHLAVLAVLLEERGLQLERGEPNRVLRRRLPQARLAEEDRRELVVLLDRLEARWFRDRTEEPDLYAAWRALYVRLAARPASV